MKSTVNCSEDSHHPDTLIELEDSAQLGKYGRLRRDYLREHRQEVYTELVLAGGLNSHLLEIDEQAYGLFDSLMTQMAEAEGVTETLKARNQLEWVQRMNSIRGRANEIVLHDLVYA